MSNLSTIARIGTAVAGLSLVLLVGACGDDPDNSASKKESATSSWTSTPPAKQPSCEEQGLVTDHESPMGYDCISQDALNARNDSKRSLNATLAAANADLTTKVENSRDQLPTIMNVFCKSPMRSAIPQRINGEQLPEGLISYSSQAQELWKQFWFSDNFLRAPYNFDRAVSLVCGEPTTIIYSPQYPTNSTTPNTLPPLWSEEGYDSQDECELHLPARMC